MASDLDQAINLLREAERLPAVDARVRAKVLGALGFALKSRYIVNLGSDRGTGDIDESILCYTEALDLLPEDTDPYPILSNLGQAYFGRCVVARDDGRSAEWAVRMHRLGVAALPPDDPDLPVALDMLASAVELLLTLDGDRSGAGGRGAHQRDRRRQRPGRFADRGAVRAQPRPAVAPD